MLSFRSFLAEAKKVAPGILHIEHPSDTTFDGEDAANHALKTLHGVASGKTPITRKIDDKMSYQAIRTPEGKVGVKYKGTGSTYNFSEADVDAQHGHKPYLAHPIKALLKHVGKVLPKRPGEYQGGFMSTPESRSVSRGHISHTPNTIEYHTPTESEEGKKLAKSKVSTVIHSELKGPLKQAHPITSMDEFQSHPDVHQVQHVVSPNERKLSAEEKKPIMHHLSQASELMKDHDYSHLAGHEGSLRTYINTTVTSGDTPSVKGYKEHLTAKHNKAIDSVKMQKTKDAKAHERDAVLAHVEKNSGAFKRSLDIHHHMQQATNLLAQALDKKAEGGFGTKIGGEKTGGEGYVGGGIKIVDRHTFSKENAKRRDQLKAGANNG